MKYIINWSEKKVTSTGKEKIDATLQDGDKMIDKVTIWSDFPNFAGIMSGGEIEGDLVEKQNGQYTNRTLYPIKAQTSQGGARGGFGGVSKLMDKKAENIEKAQDRKAESISYFNSVNSAIQLVSKFGVENMSESEIRVKMVVWRDWFLAEYKNWDSTPF